MTVQTSSASARGVGIGFVPFSVVVSVASPSATSSLLQHCLQLPSTMVTVFMVNPGQRQHGKDVNSCRRVPLWIEIYGLSHTSDAVPLTVTVAVPPKAAEFLTAKVHPAKLEGEEPDYDFMVTLPSENDYLLMFAANLKDFKFESFTCWAALLNNGVLLYWMVFVGTYPEFPTGSGWPDWNASVPFEGSFLNSWMANLKPPHAPGPAEKVLPGPVAARTREEICRDIWTEFQGQLALFNCTLN
ncbi:hypothetical protein BC835DRAFT_1310004 [Cytidiella melzeri]|nr:hypothetical protein BC835DRAFT_1310004 [Cytidiella melzeri]